MGGRIAMKERAKMREAHRNGQKVVEIAEEFGVSKWAVYKILKEGKKKMKKRGRPSKLSKRERRELIQFVRCNPMMSATKIALATGLPVGERTVRRELARNSFHHVRIHLKHVLSVKHKEKRLEFARKHVTWTLDQWRKVIFTDEKRFNLMGNDAYVSAWVQNKQNYCQEVASNLKKGLMIWGAIGPNGGLRLICLEGKVNAEIYCEMLEDDFFSKVQGELPVNFVWQHDNAPIHVAAKTKEYLSKRTTSVLEWPALSPDLNPIKNIWGLLTQEVYKDGKTFQNTNDLWDAICTAWYAIPQSVFANLYNSMPARLIKVLEEKGERIKY